MALPDSSMVNRLRGCGSRCRGGARAEAGGVRVPPVRARFVPDVPDGYLPLGEAARSLGCARQTVLHKVQRGELDAVQVTTGRRKGLRIQVSGAATGLLDQ